MSESNKQIKIAFNHCQHSHQRAADSNCNKNEIKVEDCSISAAHFGELIDMRESQEIN